MLRYALESADFDVAEAENVTNARLLMRSLVPDLILLDWMLPDISGVEFTRQIKADIKTQDIPIILLTAKAQEDNKVKGLNAGADDYIVKPFSPRELIARIHAVLRRGSKNQIAQEKLIIRDMTIDLKAQRVLYRKEVLKFGPLEYRLLCFLANHPERVYSRDELLSSVWGNDAYLDERTVDVHIRRLRKRLSHCGYEDLVQTVHGSGYRFSEKIE